MIICLKVTKQLDKNSISMQIVEIALGALINDENEVICSPPFLLVLQVMFFVSK